LENGVETHADKAHAHLCTLLEVLLPQDRGYAVLMLAFFDESGTETGSRLMCVAGYVFTPESYRQFDLEWADKLRAAGIGYWHTVRSVRQRGPFAGKTDREVAALARALRGSIYHHAAIGAVASVCEGEFNTMAPAGWFDDYGTAYTVCAQICLSRIQLWADENGIDGPFAYFFESGHRDQKEANAHMHLVATDANLRAQFRYGSHSFADKKAMRGLQAADMLAWSYRRTVKDFVFDDGAGPLRKDAACLVMHRGGKRDEPLIHHMEGDELRDFFARHSVPAYPKEHSSS
jgi:hypothetical protein